MAEDPAIQEDFRKISLENTINLIEVLNKIALSNEVIANHLASMSEDSKTMRERFLQSNQPNGD